MSGKTQRSVSSQGGVSERSGVAAAIMVPNVIVLCIIASLLLISRYGATRVEPLVVTDPSTHARIAELEQALFRNSADGTGALELARLYQKAGAVPWSYDALRQAERDGPTDLRWRMSLGLAYLGIGRNGDGRRVLKQALEACDMQRCPDHLRAKLSIFNRVAQRLYERKIDARRNPVRAGQVLRQVLKPVSADRLSKPPDRTSKPAGSPKGAPAGGTAGGGR